MWRLAEQACTCPYSPQHPTPPAPAARSSRRRPWRAPPPRSRTWRWRRGFGAGWGCAQGGWGEQSAWDASPAPLQPIALHPARASPHIHLHLGRLCQVELDPQVPRRASLRPLLAQHVRQGATLVRAQLRQGEGGPEGGGGMRARGAHCCSVCWLGGRLPQACSGGASEQLTVSRNSSSQVCLKSSGSPPSMFSTHDITLSNWWGSAAGRVAEQDDGVAA